MVMKEEMNRSTYPRREHLGEPTTPREARGESGTPALEFAKGIHGQKNANWIKTGGLNAF